MTKIVKKRFKKAILVLLIIFMSLTIWILWENKALELNYYSISDEKIPQSFEGFRISLISDFHNTMIGKDNKKLVAIIKESDPDIIAITGDIINSYRTDFDIALDFTKKLTEIAPCYYVTGNHESRLAPDVFNDFKEKIEEQGVFILDDEKTEINRSNEKITLAGVNDPSFDTDYFSGDSQSVMNLKLKRIDRDKNSYTVLLSHRPELFDIYKQNDIDLILSGHSHGGLIRLPFAGGIVAPNQGLFPEYDGGVYVRDNTSMVVSRGIGNTWYTIRINNRPEVVIAELHHS